MTKQELRKRYCETREAYKSGRLFSNEYALHLDTMLSNYFGMDLTDPPETEQ